MTQRLERPSQMTAIFLCALGLTLVALTGCDDSKSGDKAQAEAEQPAEKSGSNKDESADQKGADKQGSASPSAGKAGDDKAPSPTQKPSSDDGSKAEGGDKITDAEIKKFIEVSNTLRPKQAELKKELENAESKKEAQEAQMKVMKETRKAVEESGLSFERFKTISKRAGSDKELQQRLRKAAMEQQAQQK